MQESAKPNYSIQESAKPIVALTETRSHNHIGSWDPKQIVTPTSGLLACSAASSHTKNKPLMEMSAPVFWSFCPLIVPLGLQVLEKHLNIRSKQRVPDSHCDMYNKNGNDGNSAFGQDTLLMAMRNMSELL